jgi:hypothetical protein
MVVTYFLTTSDQSISVDLSSAVFSSHDYPRGTYASFEGANFGNDSSFTGVAFLGPGYNGSSRLTRQ